MLFARRETTVVAAETAVALKKERAETGLIECSCKLGARGSIRHENLFLRHEMTQAYYREYSFFMRDKAKNGGEKPLITAAVNGSTQQ
jgi:hypothetical protein